MIDFHKAVEEIYAKDARYKVDSYEFILQALRFTQRKLKKQGHVSGRELAGGCAKFAIEQYGPMAKAVLKHWGITKTQDFGNIVNNMIDVKLLSKTESDSIDDFTNVYSFDNVFGNIWDKSAINRKFLQSSH